MTDKKGTGAELGRIEIADDMEWIIRDDGDPDWYVAIEVVINGKRVYESAFQSMIRKKLGDEKFMEELENVGEDRYVSLI